MMCNVIELRTIIGCVGQTFSLCSKYCKFVSIYISVAENILLETFNALKFGTNHTLTSVGSEHTPLCLVQCSWR